MTLVSLKFKALGLNFCEQSRMIYHTKRLSKHFQIRKHPYCDQSSSYIKAIRRNPRPQKNKNVCVAWNGPFDLRSTNYNSKNIMQKSKHSTDTFRRMDQYISENKNKLQIKYPLLLRGIVIYFYHLILDMTQRMKVKIRGLQRWHCR